MNPKELGPCLLTQQVSQPSSGSTEKKHTVFTALQGETNLQQLPEVSVLALGAQGVEFNC